MKLLIILTCVVIFGCTKVDEANITNEFTPLNVVCMNNVLSRASGTFPDGTEIGVYVSDGMPGQGYNGKSYNNIKATVKGGELVFPEKIMVNSTPAKIYAYYPYRENVPDPWNMPINTLALPNFLAGKVEDVSFNNSNVILEMRSVFTIMRVKIRNYASTPYSTIKYATLQNGLNYTNLCIKGYFDLRFCHVMGDVDTSPHVVRYNAPSGGYQLTSYYPADESAIDILVFPFTIYSSQLFFTAVFSSGNHRTFQVPAGRWEAGTVNTYNLTVTR